MSASLGQAVWSLLAPLLLTVLVEAAVGWLAGLRSLHGQAALLLINVITNPTLNLIVSFMAFWGVHTVASPLDPVLLALECVLAAVEALLLRWAVGLPVLRALPVSAAVNAASFLAGVLLLWGK